MQAIQEVMLLGQIEKLSETYKSQVGYSCENKKNKYAQEIDEHMADWAWYNTRKNGGDWCTIFFDWCFIKTFGVEKARKILNRPKNSCGAGVSYSRNYLKSLGRVGNEPKVGCAVYFGSLPLPRHIGYVYKVTDKMIYTYEGNCYYGTNLSGVKARQYSRSDSDILDYGYPVYDEEPDPTELDGYKVNNTYEVVCTSPLNIRKGAGSSYAKIGELTKGEKIVCIGLKADSEGNTWMQFDKGWSCADYRGERYIDEPQLHGWVQRDGKWYFYDSDGKMTKNHWEFYKGDYYYMASDGVMCTGWTQIGADQYYFCPDGHMARSEWIDGLFLDMDGVQRYKHKAVWLKNNTGSWYQDESGYYPRERNVRIDMADYYFDRKGYLVD